LVVRWQPKEGFDQDDLVQRALLLANDCKYKVRKNKHNIISAVGKPGSGKTYGMIDFAIKCQKAINGKDWEVTEKLALSAQEFYKLVDIAKTGDVIIFDEIGAMTGMNSRKAMSSENIALSSLFQTIRSRNLIIIITTPNFGYIDKSLRELIDFNLTAEAIDYTNNLCKFKIQQLQVNEIKAKIYYHFPRVFIPNKGVFLMPHIYTELPPKEQTDAYEKMKFKYQDKLNKIIQGQLKRMSDKEIGMDKLKPEERKAYELYTQEIPQMQIYEELGCSGSKGKRILDTALLKMGIENKVCYAQRNKPNVGEALMKWKREQGLIK